MSVTFTKGELSQAELVTHMVGGEEPQEMIDEVDDEAPVRLEGDV